MVWHWRLVKHGRLSLFVRLITRRADFCDPTQRLAKNGIALLCRTLHMHAAMVTVGIFGASGYSGLELASLLAAHPDVRLCFVTSDRLAGQSCGALTYSTHDEGLAQSADIVFLATPPAASKALAPQIRGRVIDLSNAFRFSDNASYGLVPWFDSSKARLIANPGCYASAAILGLAPLVSAQLLQPEVIIDAASGTSGAGRRASEDYSFTELHDDLFAYKVLKHQHTPEIAMALARLGGEAFDVTFTPKLLPVRRGILATCYGRLRKGVTAAEAQAAFSRCQGPFIRIEAQAEAVRLRRVVGTNDLLLHLAIDDTNGRVVVLSALDNLLKGAAGQAVENMNLALSLPRSRGLEALRVHT
jgi:N-acetyl-gamma-glutamyl-phosphate reductase